MSGAFGEFHGDVVAKWLTEPGVDDRTMELTEPFSYTDPFDNEWEAPVGSKVNGASIPPSLWSIVGPPYVGDYRRASVVHDVACVEMPGSSAEAHKMFYYAMLCDGVNAVKALAMYKAVKNFGPVSSPVSVKWCSAVLTLVWNQTVTVSTTLS